MGTGCYKQQLSGYKWQLWATGSNLRLQVETAWLQVATGSYKQQWVATSGNWGMQVANAWLQVATRGFKQKPCGYK